MTVRLASVALDNWRYIDGLAVSRNMPDLRDLPMDRFCSFVTWWATRNAEKEADIRKFETQVWRPPKGEAGQGPWSPEAETRAFRALKAGLGK